MFNLTSLLVLIFGIGMGLIIAARRFLKNKKQAIIKEISYGFDSLDQEEESYLKDTIFRISSYHLDTRKKPKKLFGFIKLKVRHKYKNPNMGYLDLESNDKLSFLEEAKWIVERVSKFYYPDSSYPLYEVSLDELFVILNNTMDVLYRILKTLNLPDILKLSVNDLILAFKLSLKAKDVASSKEVTITLKFISYISRIIHLFTPIYWIKVLTKKATSANMMDDIMVYIFEVISTEALYVYKSSKIDSKLIDNKK